jgi:hypothetical protein
MADNTTENDKSAFRLLLPFKRRKRTLDLLSIGGTCVVCVNLLRGRALVQGDEAVEQVVARRIVVFTTGVIREVVTERALGQLLGEQIDLVQEQDDRCLHEPPRVADGVEQGQRLLHTVLKFDVSMTSSS